MNLEDIKIHCRNCKEYEKRLKGLYNSFVASTPIGEISPNIKEYLPNVRIAKAILGGCRPLFFNYENLIDIGADSFVFINEVENPEYVVKMYLNTSFSRINKYASEIDGCNENLDGRKFILNDREFTVLVNPILEILELGNPTCVATLSKYILGENEYTRYMKESREIYSNTSGVKSYENELWNALGRYIDPRNFKVDENSGVIVITDLASTLQSSV